MYNYERLNGVLHALTFYGFQQSKVNRHIFYRDMTFHVRSEVFEQFDQHMEYNASIVIELGVDRSTLSYQALSALENGKLTLHPFGTVFDTTEEGVIKAVTDCIHRLCFPGSYDLEKTPDEYDVRVLMDVVVNDIREKK